MNTISKTGSRKVALELREANQWFLAIVRFFIFTIKCIHTCSLREEIAAAVGWARSQTRQGRLVASGACRDRSTSP